METSEFIEIENVCFPSSWSFRPEDREIVVTQTVDQVIIPLVVVEFTFGLVKLTYKLSREIPHTVAAFMTGMPDCGGLGFSFTSVRIGPGELNSGLDSICCRSEMPFFFFFFLCKVQSAFHWFIWDMADHSILSVGCIFLSKVLIMGVLARALSWPLLTAFNIPITYVC
jgi:hypothetical protein